MLRYICFIFNVINIVEKPSCQGNTPGRQPGAKHPLKRWRVQPLRSRKERSPSEQLQGIGNIDKSSLLRFIKKKDKGEVKSVAWGAVAEAKRILTDEMEEELAKHLKQLAEQFHGLPPVKCSQLAFEYAEKNKIPVPANWTKAQSAGRLGYARDHMIL